MRRGFTLFENLGIKLTALLFALALYAHVLTEQKVERVLYFPLQIEGLADSLALRSSAPEAVGAHVRGTGKQIIRLSVLRPAVVLHLDGAEAGRYQRALTAADFSGVGGEGVEVLAPAEPAALSLQIEPRGSTRVPVAVRLAGEPARGFVFAGPPVVRPAEVRISGPQSWVSRVDSARTLPAPTAGRRDTLEALLPLAPPPAWASAAPGSVLVRVPIEAQVAGTRELTPRVTGLRAAFEARLIPPRVRAQWVAPRSRAAEAGRPLEAVVDLARRGRGRFVVPVQLSGPSLGYVRAVVPESVTVVVQ